MSRFFVLVLLGVLVGALAFAVAPPVPKVPTPVTVNSIGMEFVDIPAGTFSMGSPLKEEGRDDDEGPEHEVSISAFQLGVHEVTQGQYEKVTGNNPSWFSAKGRSKEKVDKIDTSRFPVEYVSWEEATAFCAALSALPAERGAGRSYRLPSEAEWEYACRAGARTKTAYWFGKSLSAKQANFGADVGRPCEVGSYPPNAWGLFDMHGNVWEWCSDRYDAKYYSVSPKKDPQGPEKGALRVFRGGSWNYFDWYSRSASREGFGSRYRDDNVGFRVVLIAGGK